MPRSAKSVKAAKPPETFEHSVQIAVRRPEFELLSSVSHLDIDRLAKAARAEIELGYLKTDCPDCCHKLVRAIIRKGMVTELRVEPCSDGKQKTKRQAPSPDLVRLLNTARERLAPPGGRPLQEPMPVAEFMRDAGGVTVDTITCIQVCFFGYCVQCCEQLGTGEWLCGRVWVDTTTIVTQ